MPDKFIRGVVRAVKAAERDRVRAHNARVREQNRAIKQAERDRKTREREVKRLQLQQAKAQKEYEKQVKLDHIAAKEQEVEELNEALEQQNSDLDKLLHDTLDFDDYVDLEQLKKTTENTAFDRPDLEEPISKPVKPDLPKKPIYSEPPRPKGFFGVKKKHQALITKAKVQLIEELKKWQKKCDNVEKQHEENLVKHAKQEQDRVIKLEKEKKRFEAELIEHNQNIDNFINNLGYGDTTAIEEYIAIVVENSIYPDHFDVEHEFKFDPESAELTMRVAVPSPSKLPAIKTYKYIKTSDTIKSTPLSKKAQKDRYTSAIYQVTLRSFHEVFEADRRELIKSISLEVGTSETDPATGKYGFIPFVAAATQRDTFLDIELGGVVPLATLQHLNAALSKDPLGLVAVDTKGIRKS